MVVREVDPAGRLELARGVLRRVERRAARATPPAATGERTLPVAPALARLLPLGALRRGTTLALTTERAPATTGEGDASWRAHTRPTAGSVRPPGRGSRPPARARRGYRAWQAGVTSLLWTLLAEASAGGAWVGVVGRPELGPVAAAEAGLRLERLALVPDTGADLLAVTSALLDGLDVVVMGGLERAALGPADRERLAARARQRGAVLLALGGWPGADVQLSCTDVRWSGLGAEGSGRLREREIVVRSQGRGIAPAGRSARFLLPGRDGVGTDALLGGEERAARAVG